MFFDCVKYKNAGNVVSVFILKCTNTILVPVIIIYYKNKFLTNKTYKEVTEELITESN